MKLNKGSKEISKEIPSKENALATGTPSKNSGSNPSTPNTSRKPSTFQRLKGKCTPMMAVVIFLVIALVGVITTLLVLQLMGKVKTCRTPECIQLAYQLKNFGNPKIDPCQDFYKASCSRYAEHSSSMTNRGIDKNDIAKKLIKSYMEANITLSSKSEINMKKLYGKCMSLKKNGALDSFYGEILSNIGIIGWWPLFDSIPNSNPGPSSFNLMDMLTNMAQLKITNFGLFNLHNIGKMMLGPSELLEMEKLRNFIYKMVSGRIQLDIIQQQIEEANDFVQKLDQISGPSLVFAKYSDMPPMQIVDIDRILRIVIGADGRLKFDSVMDKTLVIESKLYFGSSENLDTLLQNTPRNVIANFLIFKYISTTFVNFSTMQDCARYVAIKLPQASLLYFTRNFFDRDNMKPATEVVDELRTSFKEMIENSKWLSESTKQRAIRKVEKIEFRLGVPEDEGWEDYVDTIHGKFTIRDSDSVLTTIMDVDLFFLHNELESFANNAKINPGYELLTGNAQYNRVANELTIMAPYLLPPQLDDSHPKHAQLASTGVVLGHEIGHGFDRKGARHDENGDEKNWWKQDESMEYMKRTECLVDQYSNYDDPDYGKNLNGTKTVGEMTSDKLGIEASWKAYKRSDASAEPRIIGFEDEPLDKMFFRLYALTWCSPPNRHSLQLQLKQVHPTESFRVNGLLQGFKPFADAFDCPEGSPMNPRDKCQIF